MISYMMAYRINRFYRYELTFKRSKECEQNNNGKAPQTRHTHLSMDIFIPPEWLLFYRK